MKIELVCDRCGNKFLREKSYVNYQTKIGQKQVFCTKKCSCQSNLAKASPKAIISITEKFWSKVNKTPGLGPDGTCWEWLGSRGPTGYGKLSLRNKIQGFKDLPTHRLSYTINRGEIPKGLLVRHTCDNPPCVNPEHLLLGNSKDNSHDMVIRKRWRRFSTSNLKSRKLTSEEVNSIFISLKNQASINSIAKQFNMSFHSIKKILERKTYKDVSLLEC